MDKVTEIAINPWSLWRPDSNHYMRWKCLLLRVIASRGQTGIDTGDIERWVG